MSSRKIEEEFYSRSLCWTPAEIGYHAQVLFLPWINTKDIASQCQAVVSDKERMFSNEFTTKDKRARFLQRRAFRRYCATWATGTQAPLSGYEFVETETGRPFLIHHPDLWFSFSSCAEGCLGAWSASRAIGVDVEQTREVGGLSLARAYFSQAETEILARSLGRVRTMNFLRIWCLKEAALKSIGQGVPFGLNKFRFSLSPTLSMTAAPAQFGGIDAFDVHISERLGLTFALVSRDRSMVMKPLAKIHQIVCC